jgi:hypothetical protein
MLRVILGVGIIAFISGGFTANQTSDVVVTAIFSGLSAPSFVMAFLTRPSKSE